MAFGFPWETLVLARLVIISAVAVSCSCFGCGRGGLGTIPIRGKVVYNGEPLGHGEVLYNPVDVSQRRARGKIQSDGTFKLTTLEKDDGALPGEIIELPCLLSRPIPANPAERWNRRVGRELFRELNVVM